MQCFLAVLTLIVWGGEDKPSDVKFSEMCPCSHNNNTALIKEIYLIDAALVMTNS